MTVERYAVEANQIALFARAVGDANPVYYDEKIAKKGETGGIIAPPTFIQSSAQFDPEYPLRPRIGEPWFGSGKEPTGTPPKASDDGKEKGGGGLHAEQHFEYHRNLRPGDVLHAKKTPGKTWEKEGRKAGKLLFSETVVEYYDQNNELVITARSVGVRTERVVKSD